MLKPTPKHLLGAGILLVVAITSFNHRAPRHPAAAGKPVSLKAPVAAIAPAAANAPAAIVDLDLAAALKSGKIQMEWKSNGRNLLRLVAQNSGTDTLRISLAPGQIFETGANAIVLMRPAQFTVASGQSDEEEFEATALASTNQMKEQLYRPVTRTEAKIAKLLPFVQEHPELRPEAVQTAVLALTENLPLSAVARFSTAGADLPSVFDTTPFRADTCDLIAALLALRGAGIAEAQLALTIDPQLKIEAMIDPMAHAMAMTYYGITTDTEWAYWKAELLQGDVRTRHYALFGIARFYPDVALQMLPSWVREQKANLVYRQSAIHALAETQRPEAISILRQLEVELGGNSELGRSAKDAAGYLEARMQRASLKRVAFRANGNLPDL